MDKAKPAVIIPHYGDPEVTARLHGQLLASDPDWAGNVLVLDNAAPKPFPGAFTRLPENLYWAGALAFCLRHAAAKGFSHLWFVNNDISFQGQAPFLARAWSRLAWIERRLGRTVGIYSPAALANPYHPQMVANPGFEFRRLALIDGIAPLIRLECVDAVGGLDAADNPYGYGVDMWLSLRAHRLGWPLVADHQVIVRHAYHATARTLPGFLARAAAAQDAYLAARMGGGWEKTCDALKREFTDHG